MISFAYAMLENGYIPGFSGNTDSSKNFNFGRQCSHYVQFMGDVAKKSTLYWATEPKLDREPDKWEPYCPSELSPEKMSLWTAGGKVRYGDITVRRVFGRDESVTGKMW